MPPIAPVLLALLAVLGTLGAVAWVARRAGLGGSAVGGAMKIVGQVALGPRERVVILEVGDRWWLLGVGAGGVRRLGTMDRAPAPAAPAAPPLPFAGLLARLQGKP